MPGPAWTPALSDVGSRIPTRTVDMSTPGSDQLLGTFNDHTQPTDIQAQEIIDDAVRGILSIVPTVSDAISDQARVAAAWRAAADIELAYPERNADVNVYGQLDSRAKLELDRLIQAAETSGESADAVFPVWYADSPPSWANDYL